MKFDLIWKSAVRIKKKKYSRKDTLTRTINGMLVSINILIALVRRQEWNGFTNIRGEKLPSLCP